MKTYRFVTTKGSVTIPFDIRICKNWEPGTLVSVEEQKDGALLLRKESICDCGKSSKAHETSLFDVLESLKPAEQRAAFNFLTRKLLRDAEVE